MAIEELWEETQFSEEEKQRVDEYPLTYGKDSMFAFAEYCIKRKQEIDIEKACELYEEALCKAKRTGIHGIPQMVQMFKQAMEE